jgi:hypothetical protein
MPILLSPKMMAAESIANKIITYGLYKDESNLDRLLSKMKKEQPKMYNMVIELLKENGIPI